MSFTALAMIGPSKPDEISPNYQAKILEENITPDFKKKLRKWRVKKQISIGGLHSPSNTMQVSPTSPTIKDITALDAKAKIDWNLWKTGQIKLEGQGLSPMPVQKDLPEDFQEKLGLLRK